MAVNSLFDRGWGRPTQRMEEVMRRRPERRRAKASQGRTNPFGENRADEGGGARKMRWPSGTAPRPFLIGASGSSAPSAAVATPTWW
jgi:hypothetical protein